MKIGDDFKQKHRIASTCITHSWRPSSPENSSQTSRRKLARDRHRALDDLLHRHTHELLDLVRNLHRHVHVLVDDLRDVDRPLHLDGQGLRDLGCLLEQRKKSKTIKFQKFYRF